MNFRTHLEKDPTLKRLFSEVQCPPLSPSYAVYGDLLESIVYQQVSIKAAKTVFNRFCALFDGIPAPHVLESQELAHVRSVGLSGVKARYLINIAEFFNNNQLTNEQFQALTDQDIIDLLTQIKGVGKWTVQMILISSLGRSDVFPDGDLGIQQAMAELYDLKLEAKALRGAMHTIAESWRPYRTYATLLLWRWKRKQMGLDY